MYPYDRENSQLSFGWERPTNATLSGGTTHSATAISGLSGLTASALAGQMCRVLSGNQAGYIYWIIDNATTTLTVQGLHTPNESANAIGSEDRLAYSTRGIIPADIGSYNRWFGVVNAWTPPHFEQESDNLYSHGSGVKRIKPYVTKETYNGGSMPIMLQGRPEILLACGKATTTGSDTTGGGGSTLNGAAYAWENRIDITDDSDYSANDYIQIGVTSSAEVRKLESNPTGSVWILDHPLDYSHADDAACNQVQTPWVTTVTPSTTVNRTWAEVEAISDPEADETDLVRIWAGNHLDSFEFSSTEDTEFGVTIGHVAMTHNYDDDGTYTKPTVTLTADGATEDPYFHDSSTIQHNSVDLAIVTELSGKWSWNLEAVRPHGANNGKKPYIYVRKYPEFDVSGSYIPVNTFLLSKVDDTERDGYLTLTRATTDYIKISWTDTIILSDKWDAPESGHYEGNFTASPEYLSIEISIDDTVPMY